MVRKLVQVPEDKVSSIPNVRLQRVVFCDIGLDTSSSSKCPIVDISCAQLNSIIQHSPDVLQRNKGRLHMFHTTLVQNAPYLSSEHASIYTFFTPRWISKLGLLYHLNSETSRTFVQSRLDFTQTGIYSGSRYKCRSHSQSKERLHELETYYGPNRFGLISTK
jgi:hypothetical protein